MEEETNSTLTLLSPPDVDLDLSFTSTTSSSATASTFASSSCPSSARSSLSLSLPSFAAASSLDPHPHSRSSPDPRWPALRAAVRLSPDGALRLRHLKLLRPIGSGHLARVFHCRLRGFDGADFALKVVDLDALAAKPDDDDDEADDKLWHVRTEGHVLSSLDHPFLPTLYARLDAGHYSCFLIDYCPGGDLHSLLSRRPGRRLPPPAARFYAAEVLLALEYLHALGFVYRDLKPENVLLRGDGHVMLSDFDLCFHSDDVKPSLHRLKRARRSTRRRSFFSCLGGARNKEQEVESDIEEEELEVVAEPTSAFSKACVGTHEYLAPEVVSGGGHGSGVDWWAFGVFLYELLYGTTPFKGRTKEATLRNITACELRFPEESESGSSAAAARDLIGRLLVKDPARRLGSERGAAEIKRHPFFEGVRWALIRCSRPPVGPPPARGGSKIKNRSDGKWSEGWKWSRWGKSGVSGVKFGLGAEKKKKRTKNARK